MDVKPRPVVIACFLCVAILVVSVSRGSASVIDATMTPHAELDVAQNLTAGDRVTISIRVDDGMLARFLFMNGAQFLNWTTNHSYSEMLNQWIYNDLKTSQEDRIYEVPANDTYHLVLFNDNGSNITVHYEFLIQQPSSIAGMPVALLFATIGMIVAISCKRVLRLSRTAGGSQSL